MKNPHQPQHVATPAAAPTSEEQSLPATGTSLTTTLLVLAAGNAALGALLHFTPTATRRRRRS